MPLSSEDPTDHNHPHWRCAEPRWRLFHYNQDIWRAVFEECDAASRCIDLEQFIFAADGVGKELLDLLAAKARQGVRVRVLADGLGSHGLPRSEAGQALIRNGGRIAMHNGVSSLLRKPLSSLGRLHRKTLICDGTKVMVGGSCYVDRMSNWRDTMLLVGGPLPPAVPAAFERAWDAVNAPPSEPFPIKSDSLAPEAHWSFAQSGSPTQVLPDLREEIPAKIAHAERSVRLTTPYLVPDRRLWRAMTTAADRGATVQVLLPEQSDHRVLDLIGRRFARALQRRGVEVRGYTPGMLHAKVALVDDSWSSVSSFNLDLFSSKLNLESGVFSTSTALHRTLAAQMDADLVHSKRL